MQGSTVSSHPEPKPTSQPASASSEAVTSPAGSLAGPFLAKVGLIGCFQHVQPLAKSSNAPISDARQQQATAEEEHMAFCCHLYSLLERAQLLCLEYMSEGQAAIEQDVSQATKSTQQVVPWAQGTCGDDTIQHLSGLSASSAVTAVRFQVLDPSAGASVQAVPGDTPVGAAQEIRSWVQDTSADRLPSQPDGQLAVAASSMASTVAATAPEALSFLPPPPSMAAVPQTLSQSAAQSPQAAPSAATRDAVPLDFPAALSLPHGHLQSAAAAVTAPDAVFMAAALAQMMHSRACDSHSLAAALVSRQRSAQTASSLLRADIDHLENKQAAVEDAHRAARPPLPHRLSSSSSHLAARLDRQEQADLEQALALSMDHTAQAGSQSYSTQLHDVPFTSSSSMEDMTGLEDFLAQLHEVPSTSSNSVQSESSSLRSSPSSPCSISSAPASAKRVPLASFEEDLQQAINNSLMGAGPVKPLVGPLQPTGALVRAFPETSRLHRNLDPLISMFPLFRETQGMTSGNHYGPYCMSCSALLSIIMYTQGNADPCGLCQHISKHMSTSSGLLVFCPQCTHTCLKCKAYPHHVDPQGPHHMPLYQPHVLRACLL